jgi:hypothetical protein
MSRHALKSIRRTIALVALPAIAASLLVAAPVSARTPVDPNTLNPAPPDFFNASCYEGANGVICDLAFADPINPIVNEPSGIVCGGTELLFSQNRWVVGKRFYDANGDLLQRHFRETFEGDFSNPATGKRVLWSQHDTLLHNLSVPGDVDSGTFKFSGQFSRITDLAGRTVLVDAGTFTQDPISGEILRSGGQHPFNDYFINGDPDALHALCDALS